MSRTPEQVAASEALTAAIETVAGAYGFLEESELVLEYVVVAATQKFDGEGGVDSSYALFMRDGKQPSTRITGLLDVASFDIKLGDR